ncbi:polyribonucleotide nucleotidyltransferase [Candidatus Walczuchella endosymbiont of Icerya purchasi]|uniref:polyribonucleotide nucleotidyltransferase n=1 Tax=Candidatus Walczuchella endosymbiont of Icerya purchasi TaxID=3066219 RepID=UPI00313C96D3
MKKSSIISEKISITYGRRIHIETGFLAKQSDGSVVVKMGNTMILATVVASKETIKKNTGFLLLTVDYKEKYYATGKIPGGFFKREVRPTYREILIPRIVDRVLRPFFTKKFHAEIQIMISLLSYDNSVLPDGLAGLAASSALAVSDIPFNGPISEVRIVRCNNKFIIHPNIEEILKYDIDMIVGASKEALIMIEGEMKEISEKEILSAIAFAQEVIKDQVNAQIRLAYKLEKFSTKRFDHFYEVQDKELYDKIQKITSDKTYKASKYSSDKKQLIEKYRNIFNEVKLHFTEEMWKEKESLAHYYYEEIKRKVIRTLILSENHRIDGRSSKEIRPIQCCVDYLPSVHGSAIFSRGETQSLTTVTLGSSVDANRIDNALKEEKEKFYIHYNFPPFSTGDVRTIRGISRREIGHGNLAQRALKNVIPEGNPYTIRMVSDIFESNGSSSMATICAGTLALMDAGIPIKLPVSGISIGLIIEHGKEVILYDILGEEDHIGDMDLKVAGTAKGITACQMDIKIEEGISFQILEKALKQAYEGRIYILNEMLKTLSLPRKSIKPHAPKISVLEIPKEFIGSVIGTGGKMIQEIQDETNTVISIEEKGKIGFVEIVGKHQDKIDKAVQRIKAISFVPEIKGIYDAKVKSIKKFGAFVEIIPGKEYLLHISEINWERLDKVEDVLKIGDKIQVKLMGIDDRNGKIIISRKVLLPKGRK